ncbi:MAG: acetate--CoA ligase [Deltaproteobacteria bacterium]|nr:acetate--CoA ligase [Deltaproteobacteria bacterium]
MADQKTITSMMDEKRTFPPPREFAEKAHVKSLEQYKAMYKRSIEDPDGFWGEMASNLHWFKKWDRMVEEDFKEGRLAWFIGGRTNMSFNCLDRHLGTKNENKVALIFQGEPEDDVRKFTYKELHAEVCRFANVLKKHGVKKGDRVSIYLPMIPELAIAMLACTRIGAVHSIVFGGFSAEALRDRILDCKSNVLVTANVGYRSGKTIPTKVNADKAMDLAPGVKTCFVVERTKAETNMKPGRDVWWHDEVGAADVKDACPAEEMDAEDPLFILYTSGSTGKPKGVLHTTGGYMTYVATTFKYVFDHRDEDIFWCTADIGWVTGHSYIVYGPFCNAATSVMFESVPNFPKPDRFWAVVEKFKVNTFYTAPTAIRAIMRDGEEWPKKHDLSSLRLLGSVGEPINPEAWMWYHRNIGREKCPIVDTWWQTETGGILITPLPGAWPTKPGSATLPFFGVVPEVIRQDGMPCAVNEGGQLVIKRSWPGLMRRVYGDPERFKNTYFAQYPGVYYTGDGARRDEDGYYWLMGRIDDVVNVSGHRIGTAEVESALVSHTSVAEAAVVGFPHDIKGQGLYAYVTLKAGLDKSDDLKKQLLAHVTKEIGPIARPDKIHFTDGLPKTRSGKIMRRILRKIAEGDVSSLGDTSTLADPSVVDALVKTRQ